MKKWLFLPLVCFFSVFALAQEQLTFSDSIVRAPIPGVPNTAAFMIIHNAGTTPVKLIKAETPIAKRVELHTHRHENGMMKMRQVEAIEIPAMGKQFLKPGGFHIMLFGVNKLPLDETVPLTLTFSNGQSLVIQAKVVDMMAHKHHH